MSKGGKETKMEPQIVLKKVIHELIQKDDERKRHLKRRAEQARKSRQIEKDKLKSLEEEVSDLHDRLDQVRRKRRRMEENGIHTSSHGKKTNDGFLHEICPYENSIKSQAEIEKAFEKATSDILKNAATTLGAEAGLQQKPSVRNSTGAAGIGHSSSSRSDIPTATEDKAIDRLMDTLMCAYSKNYSAVFFHLAAAKIHMKICPPLLLAQMLMCASEKELNGQVDTEISKLAKTLRLTRLQVQRLLQTASQIRSELLSRAECLRHLDSVQRLSIGAHVDGTEFCIFAKVLTHVAHSSSISEKKIDTVNPRYARTKVNGTKASLSRKNGGEWETCLRTMRQIFNLQQISAIFSYEIQNNVAAGLIRRIAISG
mmetsp:Transcript_6287/g.9665  ORF Transcript_6287/g.9665 Transcript_6287/m.9665 type:complete len:371 (+) Transcript_6287:63-1175(+)